ncbi:MAG: hypothetical protein JWP48_1818 [Actinoallomurus sp.]|nr:hypothetical protein [Actinoallomurus sp.]
MTRVRKAVAVSLMTPMAAAAIAVGLSQSADAADLCPSLASASIKAPTTSPTAGSSVQVSAQISGVMLLKAHLQISGPGLDKQVGSSVTSGEIKGDVTVPKAGYFTLAVIGNGTNCTYKTAGFSVRERAVASSPTRRSAPSGAPRPGGGGTLAPGGVGTLPGGSAGNGLSGSNNYVLNPLNGASPFSLPSVAPDGSGLGFEYPSPDPQVASPPSRPVARNVSETTPIKWGQSMAIALVLLVISAHLGMWSRRQRLAAEGPRTGGGKRIGRRARRANATVTETSALAEPVVDGTSNLRDAASETEGSSRLSGGSNATDDTDATDVLDAVEADGGVPEDADSRRPGGRTYQGRRRRP